MSPSVWSYATSYRWVVNPHLSAGPVATSNIHGPFWTVLVVIYTVAAAWQCLVGRHVAR